MTNRPTSFMRMVSAILMGLSGLGQIGALWLRALTGAALADALLGFVYLIIAIGLFGQSRFSLFLAIVVPALVTGGILYITPQPEQVYKLRMAIDAVVILFSALELWRVRHNQSV